MISSNIFSGNDPKLVDVKIQKNTQSIYLIFKESEILHYGYLHSLDIELKKISSNKSLKYKNLFIILNSDNMQNNSIIILMELIVAHFLKSNLEKKLFFIYKFDQKSLANQIFLDSYLELLFDAKISNEDFVEKVLLQKRNNTYFENFFRFIVTADKNLEQLSVMATELEYFLNQKKLSLDLIDCIIEVITELSSNACEHAKADCLIYCNIYNAYNRSRKKSCRVINIIVLNISFLTLYSPIKEIYLKSKNELSPKVLNAYKYHSLFFKRNVYDLNCFFILSLFQNKVTTRKNWKLERTGGTGLTRFIQNVEPLVQENYCNLWTDKYIVMFEKEYIVNNETEIGFNKSGKYLNDIPDRNAFHFFQTMLNGTLFNMLLDIEAKEEE